VHGKPQEPPVLKRSCTKCKVWYPATPEYFYRNHQGKYGLDSRCKRCKDATNEPYRKRREQKKNKTNHKAKMKGRIREIMAEQKGENGKIEPRPSITIDFIRHRELYDQIKAIANDEIRTPEQQALYLLKVHLGAMRGVQAESVVPDPGRMAQKGGGV